MDGAADNLAKKPGEVDAVKSARSDVIRGVRRSRRRPVESVVT